MTFIDRFYSFLTDGIIFLRNIGDHTLGVQRSMQVYYGPAPMYGVLPETEPLSWFDQLMQSNFKYVIICLPILMLLVMIVVIIFGIIGLTKSRASKRTPSPKK
jgi:hypothetical protein